jgi:hypothetical protein
MLHACSYTIRLVFCYTSWRFYAFSGTNLLTRCHSASSLFSAVLCFRKATQEIFSELDKTKAKPPIIYRSFQKTEEDTERGQGPASPPGGAAQPLAAPPYGEGALVHFWHCPFAYKDPPDGKNLRTQSIFQKHIAIRRRRWPEIERVQKLFPVPYRRGESPPEVFFIAMLASGAMSE